MLYLPSIQFLLTLALIYRRATQFAISGITFRWRWLGSKERSHSCWCKQPTGLFVQTLKNGIAPEQAEAPVVNKEYPHPTLEQLNQLGKLGELVYTKLNEPGYPEVAAVDTGSAVVPWWVVLGVELVTNSSEKLEP